MLQTQQLSQLSEAQEAWESVLGQLQMEMPKASFDTWVRDTHVVSCDDSKLVIGAHSSTARDWLESRLRSTVSRSLVGIMNQSVEVEFVVHNLENKEHDDDPLDDVPEPGEDEVELQLINRLRYDKVVSPSKVVAIPGYFSRLIPEIGARSAWLYVGWRQAMWNGERGSVGGARSQRVPVRNIIRFSGLSRRTFFRAVDDESTWEGLAGLVERQDTTPRWAHGRDHRSHRIPNKYTVHMTLRLTHSDSAAIQEWLSERIQSGTTLLDALKKAAGVKDLVGELLPPEGEDILQKVNYQTVMDIAIELNGEPLSVELQEAAEALHRRIIAGFGTILITHYFLETVIPATGLTPHQAWLVTLLRDRCYVNTQTGEVRDEVYIRGGYVEMAGWLGLSRAKTIWEWLREHNSAMGGFLSVIPNHDHDESNSLRLKVRLDEPLFDGANGTHKMAQAALPAGAVDTISLAQVAPLNGADGTPGWREWHSIKLLTTDSNTPLNTNTTASAAAVILPTHCAIGVMPAALRTGGRVPPGWDLEKLLVQNHAYPRVTKELLAQNASAAAFVSWLLFACSASGIGINDPFAYAIASHREEPDRGAGDPFDRLASLPPAELIDLIDHSLKSRFELTERGGTGWNDWDSAMGPANPALKILRSILLGDSKS